MIETVKKLLGIGSAINYKQLLTEGAIILDVRSAGEYAGGHIKGSVNIPVDQIGSKLHLLSDKQLPIITCCASGVRSASAASILKSKGYVRVYNGGGWSGLQYRI